MIFFIVDDHKHKFYLFSSTHYFAACFLPFKIFGCKTNYFSVEVCAICNHLLMEFFRRVSNKFWKAEMRKNVSEETFTWKSNSSNTHVCTFCEIFQNTFPCARSNSLFGSSLITKDGTIRNHTFQTRVWKVLFLISGYHNSI